MGRHSSLRSLRSRPKALGLTYSSTLALAASVVLGCSASASLGPTDGSPTDSEASTNQCFPGAPCLGGFCSDEGYCRSETTALSALLLEVTPPAGTPPIAGVRFMNQVPELPESGELDIALGQISHVSVVVRGAEISEAQCVPPTGEVPPGTATDGTMATRVTLIPRESQIGLASPTYSKEVLPGSVGSYAVPLVAPPGRYDIHVEPLGVDGSCWRSPYLIVDQELMSGDVALNLELPVPAKLDLTLVYPGYIDVLSQWQVDIVDRVTGKVLSNRVVLKDPTGLGGELEYHAVLAYSPVDGESSTPATELVRLSPPATVTAPIVYLERSVVELFDPGEGVVDQLTSLPSPVTYTGRVNLKDTAEPAPSTVTLVATELSSISTGVVAAFSRTVQTDPSGVFEVDLLPGKYQVLMEPESDELAQTTTELTVSSGSDNQAGKVLEVGSRARVAGTLVTLSGAPALGVPLEAYPMASAMDVDVISAARGIIPFVPRAEVVRALDADGRLVETATFTLLADPGTFHLIARPEVSTGFAWGFALGLEVQGENIGLPDIVLSPPFVVEGTISSSDVGLVPGALVRAYAYVAGSSFTSDIEEATSIVAVGEARVDADGRYRLLLPSVAP